MHLRMFDGWLQQFDQMQHHQKFVEAQAGPLRIRASMGMSTYLRWGQLSVQSLLGGG